VKSLITSEPADTPSLPIEPNLLAAIRTLPEQQRRVLAFRIILDFDTNQTADALGIATGTVTTHLRRALTALRDQLSKEKVSY